MAPPQPQFSSTTALSPPLTPAFSADTPVPDPQARDDTPVGDTISSPNARKRSRQEDAATASLKCRRVDSHASTEAPANPVITNARTVEPGSHLGTVELSGREDEVLRRAVAESERLLRQEQERQQAQIVSHQQLPANPNYAPAHLPALAVPSDHNDNWWASGCPPPQNAMQNPQLSLQHPHSGM
jgi:hypothetical protein